MTVTYVSVVIAAYFGLLFLIAKISSRKADASTFFLANRNAPWPLVAYGMIGVAISGITFISVPGQVGDTQFSYFQFVIGIVIGLLVVALVLLPIFYRAKTITIYGFLRERFGSKSHKTGAISFMVAQTATAAFKLYLMAHVLQLLIFDAFNLPFELTVLVTLLLIWLYTYRGGIQTVILTDTLQTTFLLLAVIISIWSISNQLNFSVGELYQAMRERQVSQAFFWSWDSQQNFFRLMLTGVLLTVMTNGLDQSVMQKHLTCPDLRSSQKNIISLAIILIGVNILFLFLGGALQVYSDIQGLVLPEQTDSIYPVLAIEQLGLLSGTVFLVGIAAAAYSSADSSLTGLTTSFCVDILNFGVDDNRQQLRKLIHLGFTLLIFLMILLFEAINNDSVLYAFIRTSGFIYGPLVGLFTFGIFSQRKVPDRWVPLVVIMAPLLSVLIDLTSESWLNYTFGYDILLVNSFIAVTGLYLLSFSKREKNRSYAYYMKYLKLLFSFFLPLLFQPSYAQQSLEEVFHNPPPEARPWGYWIWSHGNFDYATMDRELEAFQEMGLGGVDIFDIGVRDRLDVIPPGPAFMSAEQVDGMAYALNKAQELGLGMGLIVSSSWNAGGSWTKPEDQIKNLVVWQDTLEGPVSMDHLPFPEVPTEFVKPYATLKLYPELDSEGKPQYYENVALMAYPLSESGVIADTASLRFFDKDLPEKEEGSLELPEGKWVVSRAIETNYGQKLFVPSDNSNGYTIDHFSKQATQRHFNYIIERLQARLGDLSKTALKRFYLASYEATATIMWTSELLEIFREQNGYRLESFLPALTGTTVIDEETTERFLYDYRKTISELFIEGHYREARRISHQHGLKIASESGGPGPPLHNVPTEDLKALGSVDIMRGEFWNREPIHRHENGLDVLQVVKNIGSAAHIYGRKIVEMESFTSMQHWQEGPMILKRLADQAFCEGMTRVVYHTMPHSPPEAGLPGWSYSAGTHIHPNMTWWEMSKPFHRYLATVSGMLMQGVFVADVAYYYGSSIPNFARPKHVRPGLGFGYDYDDLNTEVLLTADVRDGRVVLPSGMEYPLLVLPDDERMELPVLEKIAELLQKGATILGSKPSRVYGLTNYREQEEKLNQIADEIWGSGKAKNVNRKYGTGRIISGSTAREVLSDLGISPDFQYQSSFSGEGLDYIHRRTKAADIYFLRNIDSVAVQVEASFRVTGKQPELWNATDLSMKKAGIFQEKEGRTYLPITLPAWGSVMVIFQSDLSSNDQHITQVVQEEEKLFPRAEALESYHPFSAIREGSGPWSFQAEQSGDYQLQWSDGTTEEIAIKSSVAIPWEGPWDVRFPRGWGVEPLQTFEELVSWTEAEESNMKYFSGTATYRNQLEITPEQLSGQPQVWLDLGKVHEVANVYLNGVQVDRSCFAPYRYDVTDVVRPGENFLVVHVANTWENRLKGDVHVSPENAFTSTNVASGNSWADRPWKDKPLQPSGLLGPVRIILQPTANLSTP